jgi:hypothetical protein
MIGCKTGLFSPFASWGNALRALMLPKKIRRLLMHAAVQPLKFAYQENGSKNKPYRILDVSAIVKLKVANGFESGLKREEGKSLSAPASWMHPDHSGTSKTRG